jgi:hypothetical protein
MSWYHFIAYFFAGAFAANGVPHYFRGVTGRRFPTPFAVPPGRGESPPLTNVLWGLANFVIAFLLLQVGAFSGGFTWSMLTFLIGFTIMSVMLVKHFGQLYTPSH